MPERLRTRGKFQRKYAEATCSMTGGERTTVQSGHLSELGGATCCTAGLYLLGGPKISST
jgi:hypothetical protein